jgi:hypothetical protein
MQIKTLGMVAAGALVVALAARSASNNNQPVDIAVSKGAKWIASVQGHDGGWGQDGGETSYVRQGEHLETNGNDVANTAVAALALRRAGNQYQANVARAIEYILREVENSPAEGLVITNHNGTQIQRKLGLYIDTFLTSKLLTEVDGTMATAAENARVRKALEKVVAKIESNQQKDGSWNVGGGWAPILGTSMASSSLFDAKRKGVVVRDSTMARVDEYTKKAPASAPAAAGVPLYQSAQALEQLSRTSADRAANAPQINAIKSQLKDARFVNGYGSVGGEEFFSYLNVSDSLRRTGGEEWKQWHTDITARLLKLQNEDGTWAGSHCITGRVAVTSAAILNLAAK